MKLGRQACKAPETGNSGLVHANFDLKLSTSTDSNSDNVSPNKQTDNHGLVVPDCWHTPCSTSQVFGGCSGSLSKSGLVGFVVFGRRVWQAGKLEQVEDLGTDRKVSHC